MGNLQQRDVLSSPPQRVQSILPRVAFPAERSAAAFADEEDEPTGVLGTLKEMPVSEVVQALAQAMKDALIEVKPKGEPVGVIGIERGRVVYAQTEDHSGAQLMGEAAFFKLFCAHRGAFRIRYGRQPEVHNINRDPTWLLLEGARLLDEERAFRPQFETPADGIPFAPPSRTPVEPLPTTDASPTSARAALRSVRSGPFSNFFDEAGVKAKPPVPLPVEAQRFQSLHVQADSIIDDVDHLDSDRTTRERHSLTGI